jgi:hypothetical protein
VCRTPLLCAHACCAALRCPQDENSDLLRESLSCALKLPAADDAADIDDDGRPIQRAAPPKP